ncbi:WhiB family transcriptional regulator [Rhodococcus ruber]|uniref:WhiB family transcriptional regulator n=1 Tax=Rhodococcus TaxID=1827 RepID=UPI00029AE22A|nr:MULTISPECIES: WhiB family transcriptional regulator [Rhodococcus]ATQ30199.1 WhiB family transcriptional regulator [Rhodococcus ruber]
MAAAALHAPNLQYESTPVADTSWRHRGACGYYGPALFFGLDSEGEPAGDRLRRERRAKAICSRCPVLVLCREFALQSGEFGIWGGTTERERRCIRDKRARACT